MTCNVRDRQFSRPHPRRNADQVIRNIPRQLDGDRTIDSALVIAVELANRECRTLDLGQILSGSIVGSYPLCNTTALDDTHLPAGNALDLNLTRCHIQVKGLE